MHELCDPINLRQSLLCALKEVKSNLTLQYAYHISLLVDNKGQMLLFDYYVNMFDKVNGFHIWVSDTNLPLLLSVVFQLCCWFLGFAHSKCYVSSCFRYSITFNKYTFMGNLICQSLFTHTLLTHQEFESILSCVSKFLNYAEPHSGRFCLAAVSSSAQRNKHHLCVPKFFTLTLPLVLWHDLPHNRPH